MTEQAKNLEQLYRACDPEEDLLGGKAHPFYIDLSAGRGRASVTNRIRRTINLAGANSDQNTGHCKVLLTGHRGTGKTTELNSLSIDLAEDGYFVVRFSGQAEFNLNDVGWQDLLLEMAFQVYDQGTSATRAGTIQHAPSERLLKQVESWLDKTSLKEIVKTKGELETKGEVGVKSILPWINLQATFKSLYKAGSERTRQVRRDLEPRADQLTTDLNVFLDDFEVKLKQEGKKGLVVIIDGLEKMTLNTGDLHANCHVDLFVNHASNLKSPKCHIVYTMPISLLYDHNLGEYYPRMEPLLLPMVMVHTRDRSPHPKGVDLMRELLVKRGDIDHLIEASAVQELIIKSGGHVRDLLRLIRAACFEAMDAKREHITLADAHQAVTYFANDAYSKMAHEAIPELTEVYQTQHLAKQHGHLAQKLLVMEYRNEESWNDVHPCILELPRIRKALSITLTDPI